MSHRSTKLRTRIAAAILAVALVPASAGAIGYYNLPGNFCQCFGYGVGAGYHAPLVLGPISNHGCFADNLRRLPYAPAPYCDWSARGYDGGECGCAIGEPSMLEPTVAPTEAPLPAPALAPAAYRVPFRY
jgi:hypothetical protein